MSTATATSTSSTTSPFSSTSSTTSTFRRFIILDSETIREARDKEEERRPRKRARVDSEDEDARPANAHAHPRTDGHGAKVNRSSGKTNGHGSGANGKYSSGGEEGSKKAKYNFNFNAGSNSSSSTSNGNGNGSGSGSKPAQSEETQEEEVKTVQRDPTYFNLDPLANVHVQIGEVLFKMHEQLLSCCTYMLEHHERHVKAQGPTSETKPIFFDLATLDEFRAFLWALYASAEELAASPHEQPTVDRLLLLLSLTEKYHIPKLHLWTLTALHSTATNAIYMESCSSAALTRLLDAVLEHSIASRAEHRSHSYTFPPHLRLHSRDPPPQPSEAQQADEAQRRALVHDTIRGITTRWSARLEHKSAPSVPAIQVVDRWVDGGEGGRGLKLESEVSGMLAELKGVAYYVHVQDMVDRQGGVGGGGGGKSEDLDGGAGGGVTPRGALPLRVDPKLSNGQVMRLLAGYFSLVSLWERLRLHPIPLPLPSPSPSSPHPTTTSSTPSSSSSCTPDQHKSKCTPTWERRWSQACGWKRIMGYSSADILGLLECLRDQLAGDEELKAGGAGTGTGQGGICAECRLAGLKAIRELRARTKEGLADHFFAVV